MNKESTHFCVLTINDNELGIHFFRARLICEVLMPKVDVRAQFYLCRIKITLSNALSQRMF